MHSEMFAQTLLWSFTMNFCICKYDSPRGSRINERLCQPPGTRALFPSDLDDAKPFITSRIRHSCSRYESLILDRFRRITRIRRSILKLTQLFLGYQNADRENDEQVCTCK